MISYDESVIELRQRVDLTVDLAVILLAQFDLLHLYMTLYKTVLCEHVRLGGSRTAYIALSSLKRALTTEPKPPLPCSSRTRMVRDP